MSREIPQATKQRAVEMYESGEAAKVIGAELDIHPSTVIKWVRAAGGKVRPSMSAGHDPVESSPNRLDLARWVRDGLTWRYESA